MRAGYWRRPPAVGIPEEEKGKQGEVLDQGWAEGLRFSIPAAKGAWVGLRVHGVHSPSPSPSPLGPVALADVVEVAAYVLL